jgi:multiple sugar transport system substrate-binding protein
LEYGRRIGSAERMYGYVMRAAKGNAVMADFMTLFWAFGADVFDAGGKPAVNTPEAVEALRFMVELGRITPPGYASFNTDEVSAHLLQATAVMSINWPSWIPAMDDPGKSKVVGRIAFAPVPSGRRPGQATLGAWIVAIPAASRQRDLAARFLEWATAPEQMKQAALRGNPPTRRSVFEDPDLVGRFRAFPAQLASLETARPRPRTPLWNEIEEAFGIYLSLANAGGISTEEALRRSQAEIEAILERNP